MASTQEQINQRFRDIFNRFLDGELDGGQNRDGSLRPFELHFGENLVDGEGQPIPNVFGSLAELPTIIKAGIDGAKPGFEILQQQVGEDFLDADFEDTFNCFTLRVFLPGMRLPWQKTDILGRKADKTIIRSIFGSCFLRAAYSMRYSEGCDQNGEPFVDDEPKHGTRNYDERKDLWTQYKSSSLSKEQYVAALRKLFEGRPPDRSPIESFSTEIPLDAVMSLGPSPYQSSDVEDLDYDFVKLGPETAHMHLVFSHLE